MGANKRAMISVIVFVLVSFIFIVSSLGMKSKGSEIETKNIVIVTDTVADLNEEVIEQADEEPLIVVRSSTKEKETAEDEDYNPDHIKIVVNGEDVYVDLDENTEPEEEILTVTSDELVKWAFTAYYEGWQYVYAGCEEGYVDCSGLIKSKVEVCARGTEELLAESALSGPIETIPDIPGLGVYYPGHVGIYVGDGKVIDARTEASGIGYDDIEYEHWTNWFEIKGVDYSRYTNDGNE